MNKYQELHERQQKEFNDFPIMFAFDDAQFKEGMVRLGVSSENRLLSIGCGGFIRKDDAPKFTSMNNKHRLEMAASMEDPEFVYDAFLYELGNREYCITGDIEDTLDALDLTEEQVINTPMLLEQLKKAKKDYLKSIREEQ